MFALALGVTAGVVIRRNVPAMAATLVAFAAVRLAVTYWVRPYFATPLHLVLPLSGAALEALAAAAGVHLYPVTLGLYTWPPGASSYE